MLCTLITVLVFFAKKVFGNINFGSLVLICLLMLEIRLKILRGEVLKSKHFNVYFPAFQFTVHVLDQAERRGSHVVTARHRWLRRPSMCL